MVVSLVIAVVVITVIVVCCCLKKTGQWRSQNVNVMHIKGRLLEQAVIIFICAPFQNGNFSKRNEFAPRGSKFFPSRAVPYGMENHFYHVGALNVTMFITNVRNCVMGATPMQVQ